MGSARGDQNPSDQEENEILKILENLGTDQILAALSQQTDGINTLSDEEVCGVALASNGTLPLSPEPLAPSVCQTPKTPTLPPDSPQSSEPVFVGDIMMWRPITPPSPEDEKQLVSTSPEHAGTQHPAANSSSSSEAKGNEAKRPKRNVTAFFNFNRIAASSASVRADEQPTIPTFTIEQLTSSTFTIGQPTSPTFTMS